MRPIATSSTARLVLLAAHLGLLAGGARDASSQAPDRQLPVTIDARPVNPVFAVGEPILIDIEIRNDTHGPISFATFGLEPNDWNGETAGVELSEIRRLPGSGFIWLARPEMDVPLRIAGPTSRTIPPGGALSRVIDLSKWRVTGDWTVGSYEATLRVDQIQIDAYTTASVQSDPFHFDIRAGRADREAGVDRARRFP